MKDLYLFTHSEIMAVKIAIKLYLELTQSQSQSKLNNKLNQFLSNNYQLSSLLRYHIINPLRVYRQKTGQK